MYLYVTSKNSGPTWSGPDPITMVYLGKSLEEAIEAVGDFAKYETEVYKPQLIGDKYHLHSALPPEVRREILRWYAADGCWSVVEMMSFL